MWPFPPDILDLYADSLHLTQDVCTITGVLISQRLSIVPISSASHTVFWLVESRRPPHTCMTRPLLHMCYTAVAVSSGCTPCAVGILSTKESTLIPRRVSAPQPHHHGGVAKGVKQALLPTNIWTSC